MLLRTASGCCLQLLLVWAIFASFLEAAATVTATTAAAAAAAAAAEPLEVDAQQQMRPPLLIALAGGSGCGKTVFANQVRKLASEDSGDRLRIAVVEMDSYYRSLSEVDHLEALKGNVNFDRIEAFDLELFSNDIISMKHNDSWPMSLPQYDFKTHQNVAGARVLEKPDAVIVEGLFVLAVPGLQEMFDLKVFVRDDADSCLVRRIRRDSEERGIDPLVGLLQYELHVKKAYDDVIEPSSRHADVTVPGVTQSFRAAELVSAWISRKSATEDESSPPVCA